jgi:large subunit ribosomal protein L18
MAVRSRIHRRERRQARVRRKIIGTATRPRLNVFRSLSGIYAQIIDDGQGRTLIAASTLDQDIRTRSEGLSKTEQAKLVGKAVGERAVSQGVKEVVFDRGGYRYHGRVKALADAAREAGLVF